MLDNYKVILWDFDGVIMDSMPVRSRGFEEVLKDYPKKQVDLLMDFHLRNGGLSRYVKFRYFFEEIRHEAVTDQEILNLSSRFSAIILSMLINKHLLIDDSVTFIRNNYQRFSMHIVSGSDQAELRKICDALQLTPYFKSIHGSPTPKQQLVKEVLEDNNYNKTETVLIGDSVNDYDAAKANQIDFYSYNNDGIRNLSGNYIESFQN